MLYVSTQNKSCLVLSETPKTSFSPSDSFQLSYLRGCVLVIVCRRDLLHGADFSFSHIHNSVVQLSITILKRHYENTHMQYNVIFHGCKNDNFQKKICDSLFILLKT